MRSPSVEHHPIIIGTALHLHADAKHLGQLRIQMPKGIADLDSSPAADSIGQRQGQGVGNRLPDGHDHPTRFF